MAHIAWHTSLYVRLHPFYSHICWVKYLELVLENMLLPLPSSFRDKTRGIGPLLDQTYKTLYFTSTLSGPKHLELKRSCATAFPFWEQSNWNLEGHSRSWKRLFCFLVLVSHVSTSVGVAAVAVALPVLPVAFPFHRVGAGLLQKQHENRLVIAIK